MQNPANMQQNIALAKATPSVFLKRDTPLLIDEWQLIPFIWDSIRYEIDKRGEFNQFILTGSSSLLIYRLFIIVVLEESHLYCFAQCLSMNLLILQDNIPSLICFEIFIHQGQ